MIDRSFLEKLEQMAECRIHEIHGRQYAERSLVLVPDTVRPKALQVNTLTGLVDYLKANIDELKGPELILHVESERAVDLLGKLEGDDAGRCFYLQAKLPESMKAFAFGQWMDQETFIINLQTQFVPNPGREAVLACVGKMKAEHVMNQDDDGVTQTVKLRKGVAFTEAANLPNPVALIPYRTFREIAQPQSLFVLRARDAKEGEPPRCALFEADGAAWQLEAVAAIRDWLREELSVFGALAVIA